MYYNHIFWSALWWFFLKGECPNNQNKHWKSRIKFVINNSNFSIQILFIFSCKVKRLYCTVWVLTPVLLNYINSTSHVSPCITSIILWNCKRTEIDNYCGTFIRDFIPLLLTFHVTASLHLFTLIVNANKSRLIPVTFMRNMD